MRSNDLPCGHMTYVLQMTLMGMGVAIIAAQFRGDLLGFVTHYEQTLKLNALVFSIISVVVSLFLWVTSNQYSIGFCPPDIHYIPGNMQG